MFVRILLGLMLACLPMSARADSGDTVTVMTRNIYLGADVGPAMKLLPNFSASAEFMWGQVKQTDFSLRARGLAAEIESINPDVVAIQEATKWICTPHVWSKKTVVYDFTQELISELAKGGSKYRIASAAGKDAFNVGFAINPIPGLTMVHDPQTFQKLFGTDDAACGFQIADTLLVKSEFEIVNAGTSEYEKSYTIIPTLMTVYRGYSWADINIHGSVIRFIATHLESLFDEGKVPVAKLQAEQLIADTNAVEMPLVVMGDFNSDPRDPRKPADPNPGEQPVANESCEPQVGDPTSATALDQCNAYWSMVQSGFMDSGPDPTKPANFSWGYDALLKGPATSRPAGMTDRLDYIFTKHFQQPISAQVFGNRFPEGVGVWNCGGNQCAASDHAGVAVTLHLPVSTQVDAAQPDHNPIPLGFWKMMGIASLAVIALRLRRRFIKNTDLLENINSEV